MLYLSQDFYERPVAERRIIFKMAKFGAEFIRICRLAHLGDTFLETSSAKENSWYFRRRVSHN